MVCAEYGSEGGILRRVVEAGGFTIGRVDNNLDFTGRDFGSIRKLEGNVLEKLRARSIRRRGNKNLKKEGFNKRGKGSPHFSEVREDIKDFIKEVLEGRDVGRRRLGSNVDKAVQEVNLTETD